MLKPVVIFIIYQIVNLLLKTHLLNDNIKSMDLLACVMLDIIGNSCINLYIMKNYTQNIRFKS